MKMLQKVRRKEDFVGRLKWLEIARMYTYLEKWQTASKFPCSCKFKKSQKFDIHIEPTIYFDREIILQVKNGY